MRFFASASALLAMATSVVAQTPGFNPIYTPGNYEAVPAGAPFEITWSAPGNWRNDKVQIELIGGASQQTLVPMGTIATGIVNSVEKYSWNVDASLGKDNLYGLIIRLEGQSATFQYSMPFTIKAKAVVDTPSQTPSGETPNETANETASQTAVQSSSGASSTGSAVTTLTTATGIKTVTLESCPPTSTATPPPAIPTSSFVAPINTTTTATWSTISKALNTTAYITPTLLPPTSIAQTVPTGPAVVPTGVQAAAPRFGAGSVAIFGGVALALLL